MFQHLKKTYIPQFYVCFLETWILYRGKEQGLSKVVREAYKNYEEMEFKTKLEDKKINNEDRHIKLIKIAGLKVLFHEIVFMNNIPCPHDPSTIF